MVAGAEERPVLMLHAVQGGLGGMYPSRRGCAPLHLLRVQVHAGHPPTGIPLLHELPDGQVALLGEHPSFPGQRLVHDEHLVGRGRTPTRHPLQRLDVGVLGLSLEVLLLLFPVVLLESGRDHHRGRLLQGILSRDAGERLARAQPVHHQQTWLVLFLDAVHHPLLVGEQGGPQLRRLHQGVSETVIEVRSLVVRLHLGTDEGADDRAVVGPHALDQEVSLEGPVLLERPVVPLLPVVWQLGQQGLGTVYHLGGEIAPLLDTVVGVGGELEQGGAQGTGDPGARKGALPPLQGQGPGRRMTFLLLLLRIP